MGIFWCKEESPKKEPSSPFRISELKEEELVVHKLNYMKTVLNEQKAKYLDQETREIALAKELKKTNVSEAKFHIQKAKVCRTMKNRISDRIFLVTRQIANLESAQEDLAFATTLESSNKLLKKLTMEVDSKSLSKAIEIIEQGADRSQELQDLMTKYNALPEQDLNKDFEALGENLEGTNLPSTLRVQTIEELEKKELAFA